MMDWTKVKSRIKSMKCFTEYLLRLSRIEGKICQFDLIRVDQISSRTTPRCCHAKLKLEIFFEEFEMKRVLQKDLVFP